MLFKSTETASCMEKCTGSHNRYHKSSLAQEWNPLRCISHKSDGSWGLILDLQQFNSYWSQLSPMLHYLHVWLQDNICLHELCGDETVIYKNRDGMADGQLNIEEWKKRITSLSLIKHMKWLHSHSRWDVRGGEGRSWECSWQNSSALHLSCVYFPVWLSNTIRPTTAALTLLFKLIELMTSQHDCFDVIQ